MEHIKTMEKWLIFSNAQKREMNDVIAALEILTELNEGTVKTALYRYGLNHAQQAVLLSVAKSGQSNIPDSVSNILNQWKIPDFPLTGEDILKAGIEAGPAIGQILQSIEEWWIGQDFQPDRAACLEKMKDFN